MSNGQNSQPFYDSVDRGFRRRDAVIAVSKGLTGDEDNKAILKVAENPAAGRLVFLPYQAGSKVIPKVGAE